MLNKLFRNLFKPNKSSNTHTEAELHKKEPSNWSFDDYCNLIRIAYGIYRPIRFYCAAKGVDYSEGHANVQALMNSNETHMKEALQLVLDLITQEYLNKSSFKGAYSDFDQEWLHEKLSLVNIDEFKSGFYSHSESIFYYTFELIDSRFQSDIQIIHTILDEKWLVLKPLIRQSLAKGTNKYGERNIEYYLEEVREFYEHFYKTANLQVLEGEEIYWYLASRIISLTYTYSDADHADYPHDGLEFELWCAERIRSIGWKCNVTQSSGDQGVDIIAQNGKAIVAVQCKRYSSPVGNAAVQEVFAGMKFYGADYSCVISTAGYTPSAKVLAKSLGVYLLETNDIYEFDKIFN